MQASGKLTLDLISCAEARTLPGLFLRRCEKTPEAEAYRQYDPAAAGWRSYRWREMRALAGRWRAALARENLAPGERVAILLRNSVEWVCFDQAAQSLGLAVVPLYVTDNPENIAYILRDSDASALLLGNSEQWQALAPLRARFPRLARVLCLERAARGGAAAASGARKTPRLAAQPSEPCARARNLADAGAVDHRERPRHADPEDQTHADGAALRARDPGAVRRASRPWVKAATRAAGY